MTSDQLVLLQVCYEYCRRRRAWEPKVGSSELCNILCFVVQMEAILDLAQLSGMPRNWSIQVVDKKDLEILLHEALGGQLEVCISSSSKIWFELNIRALRVDLHFKSHWIKLKTWIPVSQSPFLRARPHLFSMGIFLSNTIQYWQTRIGAHRSSPLSALHDVPRAWDET